MSVCATPGEVVCGDFGCMLPNRCCQADINFGCVSTATCYTTTGQIGCYGTSKTLPAGTAPCFNSLDALALSTVCGVYNWCKMCTKTEYPSCNTIVVAGQNPLTAVFCDVTGGLSTYWHPTSTVAIPPVRVTDTVTDTETATTTARPTIITIGPVVTGNTAPDHGTRGLPPGAIAAIAVGGFCFLAVVGLLLFFLGRRDRGAVVQPGQAVGYGYGGAKMPVVRSPMPEVE